MEVNGSHMNRLVLCYGCYVTKLNLSKIKTVLEFASDLNMINMLEGN